MDFVNNLAKYRTERGFSQRKLSKLSGISSPTICHIETGKIAKPRESSKRKLADILGYPMEKVFPTDRICINKQEYLQLQEKFFRGRHIEVTMGISVLLRDFADQLFVGTLNG